MAESKFRELERWARLRIQAMIDLSRVPTGGTTGQVVTKTALGYGWATPTTGGGSNFGTVAVSGQSNVVADTANDTLTLVAGTNITLTTNATTDTVTIAATSGGATTVEQNLGATATWRGRFTITNAAISATSKVLCWQAPGPYTGKGTRADEAEMQPVSVVSVAPAAGSAVVTWQTPPAFTSSSLNPIPRRIGLVRGNVKFSYLILS